MKPSTDGSPARVFALALATMMVGLACGRTRMVEAPMIAGDGGGPTVAVTSGDAGRPHVAANGLPFDRGERFTGYYYCVQGRTELTLVIEDIDGNDVDAIFEFTFAGSPPGYPGGHFDPAEGSYRMRGTYEPGTRTLRLDGDSWIEQPAGYAMVNLVGKVSPTRTIAGTLSGAPQCTSFSVTPARARSDEPRRRP